MLNSYTFALAKIKTTSIELTISKRKKYLYIHPIPPEKQNKIIKNVSLNDTAFGSKMHNLQPVCISTQ